MNIWAWADLNIENFSNQMKKVKVGMDGIEHMTGVCGLYMYVNVED